MILNKNFNYTGIDVDYDFITDCYNNGCEGDICRCGHIENARISEINFSEVVESVYNDYFTESNSIWRKRDNALNAVLYGIDKEVNLYTIDRIMRKHRIWDKDSWNIEITGGYYGEEIEEVTVLREIAIKADDDILTALSIEELSQRIEFLLHVEYGSLLPQLEKCQYRVIEIEKSDIVFGVSEHLKRVSEKELEFYSDAEYNGIRGLVIKQDDKYRVIDGYHRIFTTKNPKVKVLLATKQ